MKRESAKIHSKQTVAKTAPSQHRPSNPLVVLYLGILMLGVVLFSFMVMMGESLRLDEAQSIWQTSHSLRETLAIVAEDVHVPLYHIMLHYWMILFGTSEIAVRSMSLLFSVATIPIFYLLSREILPRGWSLVATTLIALSPFMLWYANEARMYTLLTFFAVLSQYFFIRILQGKQGWGGYALTAIIGVYTHYFFFFTLAAQGLFYILNRGAFKKGSLKKFILVAFGAAAAISPWVYYFVQKGAASNTRPMLPLPSTVDFFNALAQFVFGFQTDAVNTIMLSMWPVLVIIMLVAVRKRLRFTRELNYILFAFLAPVLLAFAVSYAITPFFLSRYMAPAVAPFFIFIVWLLSQYPKRYSVTGVVIFAATLGLGLYLQTTSPENPVRENYQQSAEYIEKSSTENDVIAITAPFTVYPFEYYYDGPSAIETLPEWRRETDASIPPFESSELESQVKSLAENRDYVYVLASNDQGYQEEILQYFINNYEQTDKKRFSADMDLLVFKVGYDPRPALTKSEQ